VRTGHSEDSERMASMKALSAARCILILPAPLRFMQSSSALDLNGWANPHVFSRCSDMSSKAYIASRVVGTTLARRRPTELPQEKRSMKNLKHVFVAFMNDESGQDLIEYALVAGLIGLGAVVAMSGLATKIGTAFNTVGNSLTNAI
jgi:pilus assembly protein Flp/PilA